MCLRENIKILNEKYNKFGISFELNCSKIKIIEEKEFLLYNNPELKEELKHKYNIRFNQIDKWHIAKKGTIKLNKTRLRIQTQKSIDILASELKEYINQIKEIQLRGSIFQLFKDHWKFFDVPAAIFYHHNYKYGLLEHAVETAYYALIIYQGAQNLILEKDLIIAGAILHDIGKINCYEINHEIIDTTELSDIQGHILNGVKIVSQNIKSEKLDKLIHIIGSHHNFIEWGAPIPPKFNEAYIIFVADLLSANLK